MVPSLVPQRMLPGWKSYILSGILGDLVIIKILKKMVKAPLAAIKKKMPFRLPPITTKKLYAPRKALTYQDRCNIVQLRYGSLSDFSQHVYAVAQISRALSICWTTVKAFLNRFVARGYDMHNIKRRSVMHGTRPFTKTAEDDKKLLDEDLLRKWSNLTLV